MGSDGKRKSSSTREAACQRSAPSPDAGSWHGIAHVAAMLAHDYRAGSPGVIYIADIASQANVGIASPHWKSWEVLHPKSC